MSREKLSDKKEIALGMKAISLRTFQSRNSTHIFAVSHRSNRLTTIYNSFANHGSLRFVVSEENKRAMEQCAGWVVISMIFGSYNKIRPPMHVRRITTENIGFLMFVSNIALMRFTKLASYQIRQNESHKIGILAHSFGQ